MFDQALVFRAAAGDHDPLSCADPFEQAKATFGHGSLSTGCDFGGGVIFSQQADHFGLGKDAALGGDVDRFLSQKLSLVTLAQEYALTIMQNAICCADRPASATHPLAKDAFQQNERRKRQCGLNAEKQPATVWLLISPDLPTQAEIVEVGYQFPESKLQILFIQPSREEHRQKVCS